MYIDVRSEKHNGNYKVILYREDIIETIILNSMEVIARYIRNIVNTDKQIVYLDVRGFGIYLADCLEQIGVPYTVLKHKSLKLNIPD